MYYVSGHQILRPNGGIPKVWFGEQHGVQGERAGAVHYDSPADCTQSDWSSGQNEVDLGFIRGLEAAWRPQGRGAVCDMRCRCGCPQDRDIVWYLAQPPL